MFQTKIQKTPLRTTLLIGCLLVSSILSVWGAWPDPVTAADLEQARLNKPAPIPQAAAYGQQTFVAQHDGLSSLELLAVTHADAPPTATLTITLHGPNEQLVAQALFTSRPHNNPLQLSFEPQLTSAGTTYTLTLQGSPTNRMTVWAYTLDGYPDGSWQWFSPQATPEATVSDLRFSTRYTLTWALAGREALTQLGSLFGWLWPLWLTLFAPGLLLLSGLKHPPQLVDPWYRWGLALGISLSILPVLWLWLSTLGGAWEAQGFRWLYFAIGLITIGRLGWQWRGRSWPKLGWHALSMVGVLLIGLALRLLAARDLAWPMWVDAPHHFVIARVLAETGRLPPGYQPVLPIDQLTYHFGFHALAVAWSWLSARPLIEVWLGPGQILNALIPLAIYPVATTLTARRWGGVVAAFFVAVISFFPGYYLAWGRYSQLAGLLILAPLLSLTWILSRRITHWRGQTLLIGVAALLISGEFLTHYRLIIFWALFALVVLGVKRLSGWWQFGLALAWAGVLSAPWGWRVLSVWVPFFSLSSTNVTSPTGYNDFPANYFQTDLERTWLILAGVVIIWGLWKRSRAIWGLTMWVGLTALVLNIGTGVWLINNNSWAIILFLPGACVLAQGAVWANGGGWRWYAPTRPKWQNGLGCLWLTSLVILGGVLGARGLRVQLTMANPTTQLALPADRPALQWVADHLPAEAVVLVNAWEWQKTGWSTPDGGIWVWPLTGRRTTTPPLDHLYQPGWLPQVNAFNQQLVKITDANSDEMLKLLASANVTHIYIGARGGTLRPEMFVNSPHYQLLFTNGAAWVFAVTAP